MWRDVFFFRRVDCRVWCPLCRFIRVLAGVLVPPWLGTPAVCIANMVSVCTHMGALLGFRRLGFSFFGHRGGRMPPSCCRSQSMHVGELCGRSRCFGMSFGHIICNHRRFESRGVCYVFRRTARSQCLLRTAPCISRHLPLGPWAAPPFDTARGFHMSSAPAVLSLRTGRWMFDGAVCVRTSARRSILHIHPSKCTPALQFVAGFPLFLAASVLGATVRG